MMKFVTVLWLLSSSALADNARYAELVREQLVYPRPLTVEFANPLSTDTSDGAAMRRVVEILEREGFCSLKSSGAKIEVAPTRKGERLLIPLLDISNYKVSSWKLILGEVDVAVAGFEESEEAVQLSGSTVVKSTNEIHQLVIDVLPEEKRRVAEGHPVEWHLDRESGIVRERK